ncbi:MAG: hypothetical protein M3032_00140 [Verrucomicrobiota bacterium]|nr:hypothetical protein [Verrucomicrobiota bacterium]
MTELLNPQPGSTPKVWTIEIVEPLQRQALARLRKFGLGADRVIHGDGYAGLPKVAPFDGIIVTAAAEQIPQPLIDQLKLGGRMVIPVGSVLAMQRLLVIEKENGGKLRTRTVLPVQFVPLTRERAEKPKK